MDLNDSNNFVNKIIGMTEESLEKLDLDVYLVSKAPTTDGKPLPCVEHN